MQKVIVLIYLVFEVSAKSNEKRLYNKASTKEMSKLSPQALKGTAELLHLLNKQISEEYLDEDKNVKVDLDYYNTGYEDRKRSVEELMQLIQKNYDANLKFDAKNTNSEVRVHLISNPEVLEKFKRKLKGPLNASNVEDINEYIDYLLKTKRNSKRRKAAFRFDSLSKETRDDDESLKERYENIDETLKKNFNGNLLKLITDHSSNKKPDEDESKNQNGDTKWENNLKLRTDNTPPTRGDSSEKYKKDDAKDIQIQDENKSGGDSKEKMSTKGIQQLDNSRDEPTKEWADYDKPKKTTKNDDYRYDKKENDKDDWMQPRKSKTDQWDQDVTKRDIDRSREKKKRSKESEKREDIEETTKHDFSRADKNKMIGNKNKWSIEISDRPKPTKKSNSRYERIKADKSWEKGKKVKTENSWDTWSEKKPIKKWEMKKTPERVEKVKKWEYKPERNNYDDKPKRSKSHLRGGFGRTPIPYVGKKGIYED